MSSAGAPPHNSRAAEPTLTLEIPKHQCCWCVSPTRWATEPPKKSTGEDPTIQKYVFYCHFSQQMMHSVRLHKYAIYCCHWYFGISECFFLNYYFYSQLMGHEYIVRPAQKEPKRSKETFFRRSGTDGWFKDAMPRLHSHQVSSEIIINIKL